MSWAAAARERVVNCTQEACAKVTEMHIPILVVSGRFYHWVGSGDAQGG